MFIFMWARTLRQMQSFFLSFFVLLFFIHIILKAIKFDMFSLLQLTHFFPPIPPVKNAIHFEFVRFFHYL